MFAYMSSSAVMARGIPAPTSPESIAERLKLTRTALGYTQAMMGSLAGAGHTAWNNYETGARRISIDQALRLCTTMGLTLDWIYRGDMQTLPVVLAEKIQVEMRLEAERSRKGSSGRA